MFHTNKYNIQKNVDDFTVSLCDKVQQVVNSFTAKKETVSCLLK